MTKHVRTRSAILFCRELWREFDHHGIQTEEGTDIDQLLQSIEDQPKKEQTKKKKNKKKKKKHAKEHEEEKKEEEPVSEPKPKPVPEPVVKPIEEKPV